METFFDIFRGNKKSIIIAVGYSNDNALIDKFF